MDLFHLNSAREIRHLLSCFSIKSFSFWLQFQNHLLFTFGLEMSSLSLSLSLLQSFANTGWNILMKESSIVEQ